MKLLFDQNLVPSLVARLAAFFHASEHARGVGLGVGDDDGLWEHAKAAAFAIVSNEGDVRQLVAPRA